MRAASSASTGPQTAFISCGGPGTAKTSRSPTSTRRPGAVPTGLSSTRAPRGTSACRSTASGIVVAVGREPLAQLLLDRRVAVLLDAGDQGDGVAGEVVDGGAEAAGHDDDVGVLERAAQRRGEALHVVADHRAVHDLHADGRRAARRARPRCC